ALARYLLPDDQKVFGIDLTPGAIGCALSHMKIWTQIIEQHGGHSVSDSPSPRFLVIE
ncbi:unnamed protein product, partial [Polarella glacialis]